MAARKKGGKALFELISGGKDKPLGVPGWFGQAKPAARPEPAKAESAKTEPARPEPRVEPPRPLARPDPMTVPPPRPERVRAEPVRSEPSPRLASPAKPPARMAAASAPSAPTGREAESADAGPLIKASGGRVTLSLNQVSAAVVVIALLVIVAGAYMLGRQARPQAPGSLAPAATQPANPNVLMPTPRRAVQTPPSTQPAEAGLAPTPDDAAREKRLEYLVIQSFIKNAEDAQDIKRFLHRKGVACTLNHGAAGALIVKSMQGFASRNSPEAKQYVEWMQQLGREYRKEGGQYDFHHTPGKEYWLTEK